MSLELLGLFVTSFVVGLSGAVMPGPLVTLAIAESARAGFARGPTVVLGHAVVELLAVAGLLVGLSQLVQNDAVSGGIGTVGGLVLLWMGYGLGRSVWRGEATLRMGAVPARPGPGATRSSRWAPAQMLASPAFRGGVVSVINPYWLLWWATIGAAYVTRSLAFGIAGPVAFYLGHILSDLGWISLVSLIVSSGRRALSQRVYQGIVLFCAIVLALLGAYFLWSGSALLRQVLAG